MTMGRGIIGGHHKVVPSYQLISGYHCRSMPIYSKSCISPSNIRWYGLISYTQLICLCRMNASSYVSIPNKKPFFSPRLTLPFFSSSSVLSFYLPTTYTISVKFHFFHFLELSVNEILCSKTCNMSNPHNSTDASPIFFGSKRFEVVQFVHPIRRRTLLGEIIVKCDCMTPKKTKNPAGE